MNWMMIMGRIEAVDRTHQSIAEGLAKQLGASCTCENLVGAHITIQKYGIISMSDWFHWHWERTQITVLVQLHDGRVIIRFPSEVKVLFQDSLCNPNLIERLQEWATKLMLMV